MPASEFDLIEAIQRRLPAAGPRVRVGSGDDAAVVEAEGAVSAVSVDALIEGVHFTLPEFGYRAVGRKGVAMGLSDLAAMGAAAGEAYVALGAPADCGDEDLLALAEGVAEAAAREGVTVAGGDLVAAPVLVLSVTAVGYQPPRSALLTRSGARPGEAVVVTGELGGAAAALALLASDPSDPGPELAGAAREALLARQLDPRPRLKPGLALAETGATAMIDLSDGLGADAGHLARASACGLELELERLPVAEGVAAVAGGERRGLELAASGGEDLELLATLPVERLSEAGAAVSAAGTTLTQIGYVTDGEGVALRLPGGEQLQPRGFDHRRGSRSDSAGGSEPG